MSNGGTMPIAPDVLDEVDGVTVTIGSQNEWTATLPLSAAEAFLATPAQRATIGATVMTEILDSRPDSRSWNFARLRDSVMDRSGLGDAAASLAVLAQRDLLDNI